MKEIRDLPVEEFEKIRSSIRYGKDLDAVDEFASAPCQKAYHDRSHRRYIKWATAPNFDWHREKSLWYVKAVRYSVWEYKENIYLVADFGGILDLYRWKFTREFAKKIGLI